MGRKKFRCFFTLIFLSRSSGFELRYHVVALREPTWPTTILAVLSVKAVMTVMSVMAAPCLLQPLVGNIRVLRHSARVKTISEKIFNNHSRYRQISLQSG
jgi:hypothetical protein